MSLESMQALFCVKKSGRNGANALLLYFDSKTSVLGSSKAKEQGERVHNVDL